MWTVKPCRRLILSFFLWWIHVWINLYNQFIFQFFYDFFLNHYIQYARWKTENCLLYFIFIDYRIPEGKMIFFLLQYFLFYLFISLFICLFFIWLACFSVNLFENFNSEVFVYWLTNFESFIQLYSFDCLFFYSMNYELRHLKIH